LTGSDRAVKLRQIADAITARKPKLAELEVCQELLLRLYYENSVLIVAHMRRPRTLASHWPKPSLILTMLQRAFATMHNWLYEPKSIRRRVLY